MFQLSTFPQTYLMEIFSGRISSYVNEQPRVKHRRRQRKRNINNTYLNLLIKYIYCLVELANYATLWKWDCGTTRVVYFQSN